MNYGTSNDKWSQTLKFYCTGQIRRIVHINSGEMGRLENFKHTHTHTHTHKMHRKDMV
jgi:hypothetical protein